MKLGHLNYVDLVTPAVSRHPELVSVSISPRGREAQMNTWTLKRVQHDDIAGVSA